jgi:hypothetical protein
MGKGEFNVNIQVTCPSCKKNGRVPETAIGKHAKCPSCGARFMIAAPAQSSGPTPAAMPSPGAIEPEPLYALWPIDRGPFSIEPWRRTDDPNGKGYFTYCRARARYEIALQFLKLNVESFERAVKRMKLPADSREEIQDARQTLQDEKDDLKAFSSEFPLLIEARERIVTLLACKPEGIERNALRKTLGYRGRTSIGVICNQLDKGGWLEQTKIGSKFLLRFVELAPVTNGEFLKPEISPPLYGPSAMWRAEKGSGAEQQFI